MLREEPILQYRYDLSEVIQQAEVLGLDIVWPERLDQEADARWQIFSMLLQSKRVIEIQTVEWLRINESNDVQLEELTRDIAREIIQEFIAMGLDLEEAEAGERIRTRAQAARDKIENAIKVMSVRYGFAVESTADEFELIFTNDLWAIDIAALVLVEDDVWERFTAGGVAAALYHSLASYKANCETRAMALAMPQNRLDRVAAVQRIIAFLESLQDRFERFLCDENGGATNNSKQHLDLLRQIQSYLIDCDSVTSSPSTTEAGK